MSTTIEFHIRSALPPLADAENLSAIGYRLSAMFTADATLTSAASAAATQLATNAPVTLDPEALRAMSHNPAAYGKLLSDQLFADQTLRDSWLKARAFAAADDLQVRLRLDARADELHALRWETLRDPETDQPIALYERVRLVRTLDSADLTPVTIPPRPDLRALVVVSNPSNLAAGMAEVDVDGEVARARAALGDIPTTILGDTAGAAGRATLVNIAAHLRDGPHIVILVAHGTLRDSRPVVWLEQDDGTSHQAPGADVVAAVQRLATRPLLLILASCRSGGGGYGDTLSAIGPGLARVGVPAVLGFQGDVAMSAVKTLLPTLITELRRDGQIDRAMAAARAALGEQRPWWQAALWLRTDGRLWSEPAPPAPAQPAPGIHVGGNVGTLQVVTVTGGQVDSIIGSQHTYGAPPTQADQGSGLRQRLANHRSTLAHYLNQIAITGTANARPEVSAGIREARAEIRRIKAHLRASGQAVDDQMDDEGA